MKFNQSNSHTNRREFLKLIGSMSALTLLPFPLTGLAAKPTLSIATLFAGNINDHGFMQAGYRGLERARLELGVPTRYIDSIAPQYEQLVTALRELAHSGAALVIAHGGQNNAAAVQVAGEFPKVSFVVTQGDVFGPNFASYDVLQEQSAFLAGVLAGLSTRTGVVGHMSGIRVKPGLKGRAAFVAGVAAANPDVKVLTNFSGNQDDNALSNTIAKAQIAAGADIIFTMLNAGRDGVSEACRATGAKQIGNIIDWVQADPDVFIASAIADVSIGVFNAARDWQAGVFKPGTINKIGLENTSAVRLALHPNVLPAIREKIDVFADGIRKGSITIPESYSGSEFSV